MTTAAAKKAPQITFTINYNGESYPLDPTALDSPDNFMQQVIEKNGIPNDNSDMVITASNGDKISFGPQSTPNLRQGLTDVHKWLVHEVRTFVTHPNRTR